MPVSQATSRDSPGDTGEVRLSRILAEAAEKASDKVHAELGGNAEQNIVMSSNKAPTAEEHSRNKTEAKTPLKRFHIDVDSDEESTTSELRTYSRSSNKLSFHEEGKSPEAKPKKQKKQQETVSS